MAGSASRAVQIPDTIPAGALRTWLEWLRELRRCAGTPTLTAIARAAEERGQPVSVATIRRLLSGATLSEGVAWAVAYALAEMDRRPAAVASGRDWDAFDEQLALLFNAASSAGSDVRAGNVADLASSSRRGDDAATSQSGTGRAVPRGMVVVVPKYSYEKPDADWTLSGVERQLVVTLGRKMFSALSGEWGPLDVWEGVFSPGVEDNIEEFLKRGLEGSPLFDFLLVTFSGFERAMISSRGIELVRSTRYGEQSRLETVNLRAVLPKYKKAVILVGQKRFGPFGDGIYGLPLQEEEGQRVADPNALDASETIVVEVGSGSLDPFLQGLVLRLQIDAPLSQISRNVRGLPNAGRVWACPPHVLGGAD
ncbi:hypothetical protein [Streptomyces sp. NPDC127038]|uniref:hypothetical protein n=1 Tax=Streptomyces sp. NPDC127038 TaxID=3347114 RepID=UPI003659F286